MSDGSFVILAIGTRETGYGHITRALALYEATEQQEVVFLALVDRGGKAFLPLSGSVKSYTSSLELTKKLDNCATNLIVCDFLHADETILKSIGRIQAKIISISPISNINSAADLVITRAKIDNDGHKGSNLFGLEYLFLPQQKKSDGVSKIRVGINFGGSDPEDLLFELLKKLSELQLPLALTVLIGPGYRGRFATIFDSLIENSYIDFAVHKSPAEFWEHLSDVDILILSGGLTLYEALERGIPAVALMPDQTKIRLIPPELRALDFPRIVKTPAECISEITQIVQNPSELEERKRLIAGITFQGNAQNILAVINQYV